MASLSRSPSTASHSFQDDSTPDDAYSFRSEAASVSQQPLHEPDLSSDPDLDGADQPASPSADSLLGASFAEVQARALDFLASSSPPTARHGLPSTAAVAAPPPFDVLADLPRRSLALPPDELDLQHRNALDFLRARLDDAERDDWRYSTPPAFAAAGAGASSLAATSPPAASADDASWADRAFNLDRYQVDDLPDPPVDDVWRVEDPLTEGAGAGAGAGFGDSTMGEREWAT
ncbi:hypothetical protein JCM8097_003758 [Rhodosporidiobolus ruineniae]